MAESDFVSRARDRAIIHVDLDAFFASAEQLENPGLRGKPVIVGGPANRGVVAAASYEARKFGLKSGMPISKARRLCPKGVFLPGSHKKYKHYSKLIRNIFDYYTSIVEPLGLDEAFLDVTGSQRLMGAAPDIGRQIKRRIFFEIGLTASVGIAPNKFLAKLASQLEKPDGLVVITKKNALDIIHPLPVSFIWGVGPKVTGELDRLGIRTIGELAETPLMSLEILLGSYAKIIHDFAWGKDDRRVESSHLAKSIGSEKTFDEDLEDREEIHGKLFQIGDKVAQRLRKEGYLARFVTLKVRFSDFNTLTRRAALPKPTDVSSIILQTAEPLLDKVDWKGRRIRLLGISTSGLLKTNYFEQLSLLDESSTKTRQIETVMDKIREKFGQGSILRGEKTRWRRDDLKL